MAEIGAGRAPGPHDRCRRGARSARLGPSSRHGGRCWRPSGRGQIAEWPRGDGEMTASEHSWEPPAWARRPVYGATGDRRRTTAPPAVGADRTVSTRQLTRSMWVTLLVSGAVVGGVGAGTGTGALEVIALLLAGAFAVVFVSWLVARRRDHATRRGGGDERLPLAHRSTGAGGPDPAPDGGVPAGLP